ncbi:hypothetical protein [Candidatus Laterigemmans baculatus]|uniref:hypothetical protein n=1 Tax=Candidatus Laterigemmans baculatus TaxID=2770505 RepID=UPI0013DBD673|nr:hypothetical protein [Candidatus Laterigemmans baculatus]
MKISRTRTLLRRTFGTCSALALLAAGSLLPATSAAAAEPRWVPVIIARGEYREHLQSLPIEQRPNRPLHFYGNAVRRQHARAAGPATSRRTVAPTPFNVGPFYAPLSR